MKRILLFVLKKTVFSISIILGVVTLIFLLYNVIPADPARMSMGQRADSASIAAIKKDLGIDRPVIERYFKYLNDLSFISIHNNKEKESFWYYDKKIYKNSFSLLEIKKYTLVIKIPYLSRSYQNQRNVTDIILKALPATVVLAVASILLAAIIGIGLGTIAAIKKNTWIDKTMLTIGALGMSLPSFFAAILIAWVFAYLLGEYTHLPLTGSLFEIDDNGEGSRIVLKNLILPAITLGIRPLSVVIQLTRNSLIETMNLDFVRTARAKGLNEKRVILKHALPNSLNPVITSLSGWFASMLAGVIFIEYIFSWKGLGYELVNALNDFDLPVIMGAVIVISVFFVFINILTDITYKIFDPKVK